MHYVTSVKYIEDYKIEVAFEDNIKGIINFKNIIFSDKRPIFQELKDKKKFSQIKVDMDTIVWKNGLDLAPEFLYNLLKDDIHSSRQK